MDQDPNVAAQRQTSVLDDFQANAGGWFNGAVDLVKKGWRAMDNYPKATKWISFGIALIAGMSWGDSLKEGFFRNFPKMDNWLTRLLATAVVWGGAFLLANKGSDYLANKGAQNRADDEQAAIEQRRQWKQEWIDQGGNPNEISMSVDPHTNFNVFMRMKMQDPNFRVSPADGGIQPTRAFTTASTGQTVITAPQTGVVPGQSPWPESQPGYAHPWPTRSGP